MLDSKFVTTPIAPYFKLSFTQSLSEDLEYMARVPYSSDIGSLIAVRDLDLTNAKWY
jgi:hypothetical protein